MGDITVQAQDSGPATPEEIWAIFREAARHHKEIDRMMQESAQARKEIERMEQESAQRRKEMEQESAQRRKAIDRQLEKNSRQIGALGIHMGKVMEHLMSPKLHEKFEALGYDFNHSSRNHEIKDHNKQRLAEIDVLLENGEYAMAVEVKTHLRTKDVKDHVKRMEILRRVADQHEDKRKYLGAMAGAIVDQEVLAYALKNGFYVIIPSREAVNVEAPEGFKPRIW
jgi:Fe-S cluster assembly scaffold protein SufB